jgi:hypothetical protein
LLPYSPNIDYHRLGNNTEEAIMLLTVCAAYGGVHLAAWNFEFPTESEKVMWRVACIVAMVGTFGSWHIRGLFIDYAEYYRNKGLLAMLKESNARTAARMIFTGTIGVVFALARIVITVESFVSLRKVPAGVYATVQWSWFRIFSTWSRKESSLEICSEPFRWRVPFFSSGLMYWYFFRDNLTN